MTLHFNISGSSSLEFERMRHVGSTGSQKIGVLLSNLGTPDGTDYWSVRRYPSLKSAVERLVAKGCERILFVPLYPQYSAATTATACDKLFEALASMRSQPALRIAARTMTMTFMSMRSYQEASSGLPL